MPRLISLLLNHLTVSARVCSPAKILRSLKRVTKFLDQKNVIPIRRSPLSIKILSLVDISHSPKILSCLVLLRVSITSQKKRISFCKILPSEIVPGISNEDEDLFFTYIDGSTFQTTLVCNFCYNDSFTSTQSNRRHVRNTHFALGAGVPYNREKKKKV